MLVELWSKYYWLLNDIKDCDAQVPILGMAVFTDTKDWVLLACIENVYYKCNNLMVEILDGLLRELVTKYVAKINNFMCNIPYLLVYQHMPYL